MRGADDMAREVVLDPSPSHTGLDVNERSPPCKSDPCYRRTQGLVTSSSWHRRCWHKATPVRRRSSARAWSLSRHRSVTRLRRAGRSARCSRRHTERRLAADACEPTRRLASGHPLRLSNGALPPLLPPAAAPLCWLSPDNRQHPDACSLSVKTRAFADCARSCGCAPSLRAPLPPPCMALVARDHFFTARRRRWRPARQARSRTRLSQPKVVKAMLTATPARQPRRGSAAGQCGVSGSPLRPSSPEVLIAFCERSQRASLHLGGLSRSKP